MPLIDGRGRLFGRLNLVDASVLVAIGFLVPVMFGLYLLFRPPLPRLIAVEPSRLEPGMTRVKVRGEHLRPNLRVALGEIGARLLLADAENGFLEMPPLAPGSYDVKLLDGGQLVSTLPAGLLVPEPLPASTATIATAPPPVLLRPPRVMGGVQTGAEVIVVGAFTDLDARGAQELTRWLETRKPDRRRTWEVVGVDAPSRNLVYVQPEGLPVADRRYQVAAALLFRCTLVDDVCTAFDMRLWPDTSIPFPIDRRRDVTFRIADIHPVYTDVITLTIRSTLIPSEFAAVREQVRPGGVPSIVAAFKPWVESLEVVTETSSKDLVVDSRVRVPAINTSDGWVYRNRVLRTSDGFEVVQRSSRLAGRIIEVGPATPFPGR